MHDIEEDPEYNEFKKEFEVNHHDNVFKSVKAIFDLEYSIRERKVVKDNLPNLTFFLEVNF